MLWNQRPASSSVHDAHRSRAGFVSVGESLPEA
jgi:hypothetical protein